MKRDVSVFKQQRPPAIDSDLTLTLFHLLGKLIGKKNVLWLPSLTRISLEIAITESRRCFPDLLSASLAYLWLIVDFLAFAVKDLSREVSHSAH